jgi:hypothetical protein
MARQEALTVEWESESQGLYLLAYMRGGTLLLIFVAIGINDVGFIAGKVFLTRPL